MTFQEQADLEAMYLMHTYGRKPVQLVAGNGMKVVDDAGREHLDFISGIGAVSLGHCHPALVEAITNQAAKLIHVSNYYYIEDRAEVAQLLSDLLNDGVEEGERKPWKTFFANSGAEANECAIKLARLHARRRAERDGLPGDKVANVVVTLERSFHGRTLATLAATAQAAKQAAFQPLPAGFMSTPINDIIALEELFAAYPNEICAVMVECVQGESGVHPCTSEYLRAAREITRKNGALLICDEVQCGVFRTGKPFGFHHSGIDPDIVTVAKGVASGFPTGMCSAVPHVAEAFEPGDHGSTFGGSCLAIAAAKATLQTLSNAEAGRHVEQVGAYLRKRLAEVPHVTEVRGLGLMNAVELDDDAPSAFEVVNRGLEKGVLLNATGPKTLRFLPPLICTTEDVDALIGKLVELLGVS